VHCPTLCAAALALALAAYGCGTEQPSSPATPAPDPAVSELESQVADNEQDLRELREEVAREAQASREVEPPAGASRGGASGGGSSSGGGLLSRADRASFTALERQLGGSSGVAVSALGVDRPVSVAGSLRTGVAWSTIKVPLAVAALADGGGSSTTSLMRRAITASENAAAESLWSGLGAGASAGRAVEAQLAAAGDRRTTVQTQRVRAGFTPFGQTRWSLADQQRFIAGLVCVPESEPVLLAMDDVVADQQWGLGAVGGDAQFKGGWGPSASGGYLVRQTGVIRVGGRPLGVSLMTRPGDGAFTSGTRNATRIARWVASHVAARDVPRRARC